MKPDKTGDKQDTKFQKGKSGNPNGRPKGAKSKLAESFYKDFLESWEAHGKPALLQMATDRPTDFVKVAATILPKDVNLSGEDGGPIVITWQK